MKKIALCMIICICLILSCEIYTSIAEEQYYVVRYDGNGSYSSINEQIKEPGVPLMLTSSTPSRNTYLFLGWATSPDATEPEYYKGDTYTADENLTLYAVWMEAQDLGAIQSNTIYEITYPTTGGAWTWVKFRVPETGYYYIRSEDRYYNGTSATTSIYGPTTYSSLSSIKNYTPITETSDSGSSRTVDFSFTIELEAGVEYYIQYYLKSETLKLSFSDDVKIVRYDGNGSYSSINEQIKEPGVPLMLTSSTPSRNTYLFLGWATSPDATEPEYYKGDTYTADENLTLYAVWMEAQDLGAIQSNTIYEITYPTTGGAWTWVKFRVPETGYYYIRSEDRYYNGTSATTSIYGPTTYSSLSSIKNYTPITETSDSGSSRTVDFSFTIELEAGVEYYIQYYLKSETLKLSFKRQYADLVYGATFNIPQGVTQIEAEAFSETAIESVLVPASVSVIQARAFANCHNLSLVIIRGSQTRIDESAFEGCKALHIVAPADSTAYEMAIQNDWAFSVIQ